MADPSIVDFMNAQGQNSSFANRATLAAQNGIKGYTGTAAQNMTLLGKLQAQRSSIKSTSTNTGSALPVRPPIATPNKPIGGRLPSPVTGTFQPRTTAPTPTNAPQPTKAPSGGQYYDPTSGKIMNGSNGNSFYNVVGQNGLYKGAQDFYNNYNTAIQNGTNDLGKLGYYNWISQRFGLQKANTNQQALQQLSIKALNGDANAQNYLKSMNEKALTGKDLWNGVDPKSLAYESKAFDQYTQDNPYSDFTKQNDMNHYNMYNDMINNNKPITNGQLQYYNNIINKWNLQDQRDPYTQQQNQLTTDKQNALNAQDTALNQSIGAQDAQNFQQYQTLQQQMTDRGMNGSGIADDAYMRAQMGANANYQAAYANAATQKSNIETQYDQNIANSKIAQQTNAQQQAQQQAANALAIEKQQTTQDQFLTQQSGYVYANGKMVTGSDGKPLTTIDYQKMLETARHDQATENNTATKNAQDYAINSQKNSISAQNIQNNYNLNSAKLTAQVQHWANQDVNAANLTKLKGSQLQEQINKDEATAANARASLTNKQDLQRYDFYKTQQANAAKEIQAIQKSKTPDQNALKLWQSRYNSALKNMASILGKANGSGGGGSSQFNSDFSKAMSLEAVPKADQSAMQWIIMHESSGNSHAQNSKSSAYGYGQLLSSTQAKYDKEMGMSYKASGVNQIREMYHYVMDRYGSPQAAQQFWEKHGWY